MSVNLVDAAKMEGKPKKKWLKAATKHKGRLHEHLGVPEGEKIPEDKLRGALHSGDATIRKEAQLANTMKGFKHKGKSAKDKMKTMYGSKKNG